MNKNMEQIDKKDLSDKKIDNQIKPKIVNLFEDMNEHIHDEASYQKMRDEKHLKENE
jgi:hypothetical protein